MGFDLQPDANDLSRIGRLLSELIARGDNPEPAYRSIGEDIADHIAQNFEDQSSPWGDPWARLSAATLAKPGRGQNAEILRDTGRLRNSIQVAADSSGVTVGTNVIYAAVHQFGANKGAFGQTRRGAPIPWGDLPARPFFPIRNGNFDPPPAVGAQMVATLRSYLDEALS